MMEAMIQLDYKLTKLKGFVPALTGVCAAYFGDAYLEDKEQLEEGATALWHMIDDLKQIIEEYDNAFETAWDACVEAREELEEKTA